MITRVLFALLIVLAFWACARSDSVTTPEQPDRERGLHEVGTMSQPRYMHGATLLQRWQRS